MNNYSDLLGRAMAYRVAQKDVLANRMVHSSVVLTGRDLVYELADALITVGQQNRNLRHDLQQVNRDYDANYEELMAASEELKQLRNQVNALTDALDMVTKSQNQLRIVEVNPGFRKAVALNDGYCPCMVEKSEDTKCMCKEFREQETPGPCHCGRFEKVLEGKKL